MKHLITFENLTNEDKYIPITSAKCKVYIEETEYYNNKSNYTEDDMSDDDIAVRIDWISIPKKDRFKGLGRIEVNNIINWAKRIGAKYIVIESKRSAIDFWEKMGFDIDDQGSDISTGYLIF